VSREAECDLTVECYLVGGDEHELDLVLPPYLLTVERAGVLDIEPLPDPPRLVPGSARAVRLRLQAGLRLLGLASSAPREASMWQQRSSFAVATRRGAPPEQTPQTETQRQATRAFLSRHGVAAEDLDHV
jgi:hypothetical protein